LKESRLIINKEIQEFIKENDYASAAKCLLKLQRSKWEEINEGYIGLKSVKIKSIWFDGFKIKLQYNPNRIKSTTTNVDKKSIENRKCFLCEKNLPTEQRGIRILSSYLILCNPHPVFQEHFTIAENNHKLQKISSSFYDVILISKLLGDKYTLFYNGPTCGASIPDHLHFQAGTKRSVPIEDEFQSLKNEYGESILENEMITVTGVDDGLRRFISLETKNDKILFEVFKKVYQVCSRLNIVQEEPQMNLICIYDNKFGWRVIIFLRDKHRSSHYYLEDENRLLFSPAAVDFGGLCITPIEKDFDRMEVGLLKDIFNEVSLNKESFEYIKTAMKEILTK
jgi:hypothetical protein